MDAMYIDLAPHVKDTAGFCTEYLSISNGMKETFSSINSLSKQMKAAHEVQFDILFIPMIAEDVYHRLLEQLTKEISDVISNLKQQLSELKKLVDKCNLSQRNMAVCVAPNPHDLEVCTAELCTNYKLYPPITSLMHWTTLIFDALNNDYESRVLLIEQLESQQVKKLPGITNMWPEPSFKDFLWDYIAYTQFLTT